MAELRAIDTLPLPSAVYPCIHISYGPSWSVMRITLPYLYIILELI